MNLAPMVLFVYNRTWHAKQAIESLQANELAGQTNLFIFSDAAKNDNDKENVGQVRQYIKRISGFRSITIIERESNYGLAKNIIEGITDIISKYERVIVVEDDLLTSPFFLGFMNEALDKYKYEEDVISIHGYCLPIEYPGETFFLKGADCWGWATWERGWKLFNKDSQELMRQLRMKSLLYEFDFNGSHDFSGMLQKQIEGKVNSWAIRWYASAFLHNKLTLYPSRSLVINIGGDGSGTHPQREEEYRTSLADHKIVLHDIPVEESTFARKLMSRYFFKHRTIKGKLRKVFKWGY